MRIALQKAVDHWLGLPMCFLASCFLRSERELPARDEVKVILVSKFFGLGSIALQLPLLRALRSEYSGARIVFTTFAANVRLLELSGLVDEILPVHPDRPLQFLVDCVRCIRRTRSLRPDLAIDLEFFSKYAQLMCVMSGARYRIGLERSEFWRRRAYHRMIPIFDDEEGTAKFLAQDLALIANNPESQSANRPHVIRLRWKHILDIYGDVARAAGARSYDASMIPVATSSSARANADRWLESSGLRPECRLLAVNVNASDLVIGRRWPAHKFVELLTRLLGDDPEVLVVLTGTADERAYTESVRAALEANLHPRVANAAGELNLEEFLALLEHCNLLITNDTGPLHLAALMNTPTVSLWGPGAPEMYGPRGPQHVAVYEKYWCSPCMYLYRLEPGTFCQFQFPCVGGLEVERVLEAVRGVARGK